MEEPGVFAGKKKKCKDQKLLFIIKNRYLKLTIVVFFHVWEDTRVWTHWNYTSGMISSIAMEARILVFSILSPLGAKSLGWLRWLTA